MTLLNTSTPRVLSIAGTDPTGGAGIQADLKSIAASGGYGMCAITALVAQNTQGVRSIFCSTHRVFTRTACGSFRRCDCGRR